MLIPYPLLYHNSLIHATIFSVLRDENRHRGGENTAESKWRRGLRYGLWVLGGAAAVWMFFRFGIRWLGPFLLALGTAALLEKPVRFFTEKLKWKRGFASAGCTLLFFLVLAGTAGLAVWRVTMELEKLVYELPGMLQGLWERVEQLRGETDGVMRSLPEELRSAVDGALEEITAKLGEIPGKIAGKLPDAAAGLVRSLPGILLFFVTYAAGTFFIGISFPTVRSFLGRQIPEKLRKSLERVKGEAFSAMGAWLSAQLRLMMVTFLVMTAGFMLLRIEYAALLAAAVALVDALPVLGTGVILLPWAVGELLLGTPVRALALTLLYAIAAFVRGFLEPRLIGGSVGVHPAASLFAMYSGFCLAGVGGMIAFPMLLLVLKQLSDKGYVRLWR